MLCLSQSNFMGMPFTPGRQASVPIAMYIAAYYQSV
jgi:hypothetical protein